MITLPRLISSFVAKLVQLLDISSCNAGKNKQVIYCRLNVASGYFCKCTHFLMRSCDCFSFPAFAFALGFLRNVHSIQKKEEIKKTNKGTDFLTAQFLCVTIVVASLTTLNVRDCFFVAFQMSL